MTTPFFNYINPIKVAEALEDEDKRKKLFAPKPENVVQIGGASFPAPVPSFSMPQYAGAKTLPDKNIVNSTSSGNVNILDHVKVPDTVAMQIAQAQQQLSAARGEQVAALGQINAVPPQIVGIRDKVSSEVAAGIGAPTEATYNPTETGWKGNLRHVGESILMGLANAPRDARGNVDPMAAGIAASATALFGGGGVHKQIARQYLQPQLDEKVGRQRAQTASDVGAYGSLQKMFPNDASARAQIAEVKAQSAKEDLERGYNRESFYQNIGVKQADIDQDTIRQNAAFKNAENMAAINAILKQRSGGVQAAYNYGKSQVGFSGDINADVTKSSREVQNHIDDATLAQKEATQLEQTMNGSFLRPEEKVAIEQKLGTARAKAEASMEAAYNRANIEADLINSQFGGQKVVDVQVNSHEGKTTYVKIVKTPDAEKIIKNHFQSQVPIAGSGEQFQSDDAADYVKEWKRRRGQQ